MTASKIKSANVTNIGAIRGLVPLNLHELWEYRELVFFMLSRDIKGRYRQTAFGPLWMIINPLLNMVLFTVIFGTVAQLPTDGIPYPLFNYSALLPWTYFTGVVFSASSSLTAYRELISKVYFPRLVTPLVGTLSALIDYLISFLILVAMMWFYHYPISWTMVYLPLYLLLATLSGLAVGLWSANWIVHFRDVGSVLGYVVRLWMYATPVVYATSLIPEAWRELYRLNPLTQVVEGCRWCLLGVGSPPDWKLAYLFLIVTLGVISGAYYFRRTERSIVDIA